MVSWTAPENAGKPAIESYNVFYRKAGSGDQWSEGPQDVTATTATLTGLEADTSYEVQVSARNDEGGGVRSASVLESTNAQPNAAPAFTSTAAFSVNENQTAVGTVRATDDAEDTVTYAITGGADSAQFQIDAGSGVLSFRSAPDFENPADVASTDPANDAGNKRVHRDRHRHRRHGHPGAHGRADHHCDGG